MTEFTPEWIAKTRKTGRVSKPKLAENLCKALEEIQRLQSRVQELELQNALKDEHIIQTNINALVMVEKTNIVKGLRKRIAELEAEQRWIPVSERLPEQDGYYFVVYAKEYIGNNNKPLAQYFYKNVGWLFGNKFVTHWQERPQPLKEE